MNKIKYLITLLILVTAVYAQHEHHNHNEMKKDTVVTEKENPMPHSYSLSLPMNRNGSGTAWLPDESPVHAYMLHEKNWMLMFHGSVFLRYSKLILPNRVNLVQENGEPQTGLWQWLSVKLAITGCSSSA